MNLGEKTITTLRNRLDVTRGFSYVSYSFAETLHSVVDTLIKFDESVGLPEALLKLFPSDELTWLFQEN
jgi:hypothetical protein